MITKILSRLCLAGWFCFLLLPMQAQKIEITAEYPELTLPVVQARSSVLEASGIEITVECSRFKPRTGIATIKWIEPQRSLADRRLDLAVHKEAFENELFATVWPIEYGKESRLYNRTRYPNEALTRGLRLTTSEVNPSRGGSASTVKLEGLEPGLNYFWRVLKRDANGWISEGVIRIQAPTCPADFERD